MPATSPLVRRSILAVAVLLLLGLTWLGVTGGLHQIPRSRTAGQWTQSIAQLGYGVLSLLGAITRFRGRRWGQLVPWCWIVTMAAAAGLAPVVWGGAGVGLGLASAAAVIAAGLGMVWLFRAGLAA